MYLFFDTETTGLPKNYKAPVTDISNWPRMVQLAWQLYDESSQQIESQDFIIKPEGFTIAKEASNVHRITTERAISEGRNLEEVLELFNERINKTSVLVAHNMNFDEKIIGAEFIRKNIESHLFKKKRICTMLASVDYCKIEGYYGYKWPKLEELYFKLFSENFEDAHDASVDISATARFFWELKKIDVIKLH